MDLEDLISVVRSDLRRFCMKKVLLTVMLIGFAASLQAAKVYREDGSFFELTKTSNLSARFVAAGSERNLKDLKIVWNFGGKTLIAEESNRGEYPVYSFGKTPLVPLKQLFWRGKDSQKLAAKYNLKLKEYYASYNLSRFEVISGDPVEIAEKITTSGEGWAFPDLARELQLFEAPVTVPPADKYYAEGYQWSLKNDGTAIDVKGAEVATLANADIKFEEAMAYIADKVANGGLTAFDAGTKVAIMDSGVDLIHVDLKDKTDKGWNAVGHTEGGDYGTIQSGDPYGTAGYSHGTNCAGVAAATGNTIGTVGVCPWCGIYPVRFMEGGSGQANSDQGYLESYQKYVDDPKIVAVNCSFGPMSGFGTIPITAGEDTSHKNFMQNGRGGKGGAIVYASGNEGVDTNYMALHAKMFDLDRNGKKVQSSIISVGGSGPWDARVGYSNFGKELDIIAPTLSMTPTVGIATSYITGYGDLDKDYTNQFSGTSSAAPVITGAMGVIFSVNPALTLEEAVDILNKSADKINPETGFYDTKGHSVKFGYGRLNLLKAVRLAAGEDMCPAAEITEEIKNNIDDDCDGLVDEGFARDISKVGSACTADTDCANTDFPADRVKCLTETGSNKLNGGYCVILAAKEDCPDGTKVPGDRGAECLKDCSKNHPCEREGYYCTGENLGQCLPLCTSNEDCVGDSFCDSEGKCRRNPSEPTGPCETNEDCKYGGYCLTQVPGGFCYVQCQNGNDEYCGDGGAKCLVITIPGQGDMEMCAQGCEQDSDCRNLMGQQFKCHDFHNGKSNVCSLPCQSDSDCHNEEATCSEGECIKAGSAAKDDTSVNDSAVSDNIGAVDEDTVLVADTDAKTGSKSSGGCSLSFYE